MTTAVPPNPAAARSLSRAQIAATASFVLIMVISITMAWSQVASLSGQRQRLEDAQKTLARLDGRAAVALLKNSEGRIDEPVPEPPGSPFLEGETVTIAAADLQRRVAAAVLTAGGAVLSSQIDLEEAKPPEPKISVALSCEITQDKLQSFLYDLEAGMPFLYVDQLLVQPPSGSSSGAAGGEGTRMRVSATVSGYWRNGKS